MIDHFESLVRFRKAAFKLGCTVTEGMGKCYTACDAKGFPRGTFLGYRFYSGWLADSYEEWKVEYIREVESLLGSAQRIIDVRKALPLDEDETQEDRDMIIARFVASIPEDEESIQETLNLRLVQIAKLEKELS